MSGNPCGNQNNKSLYEMPTTFVIKYEPNHSDCISKSSLPPLPAGWCGPWSVDGEAIVDSNGHIIAHVYDYGHRTPEFIADLLNVTYPAPTKEGE